MTCRTSMISPRPGTGFVSEKSTPRGCDPRGQVHLTYGYQEGRQVCLGLAVSWAMRRKLLGYTSALRDLS